MILYLCVLILFSLHQESLKLILAMNPFLRWFCHNFPHVRIVKIVNSTTGCEMMVLLDCFSGLQREDEEKTSFINPFGTYCYLRMLEGLRNAGPTFYRMMKAALKHQVGINVLSFVGDIVVVSTKETTYISDLAETFTNMHKSQFKCNLEKYIFGVTRGKSLACLVSMKGIEANPDKIKAIIQMQPPQKRKEI
jgi:hypothetical protein